MNNELSDKIRIISHEISIFHAKILEHEIKAACDKFNVLPTDLVINYLPDNTIEILVKCSKFKLDIQYIT